MNYIKTKNYTFEFDDNIPLSDFNSILKKNEEDLISFGYSVNDNFFDVDLINKSISVNGKELELTLPKGKDARWISFTRKTKTFPSGEIKVLGYGFGFQFKSGEKNVKRIAYYDLDSSKIVVEE